MNIPKLKDILSGKRTRLGGDYLDLQVVVDMPDGSTDVELPFTYHPDDTTGLNPQVKAWLAENELTIGDYVAPPAPLQPISRPAFLFMMSKIGVSKQDVYGLIDAMPEGTTEEQDAKTLARLVFDETQTFERNNELLNTLATAKGLTKEQVDAAWRQGQALKW